MVIYIVYIAADDLATPLDLPNGFDQVPSQYFGLGARCVKQAEATECFVFDTML